MVLEEGRHKREPMCRSEIQYHGGIQGGVHIVCGDVQVSGADDGLVK